MLTFVAMSLFLSVAIALQQLGVACVECLPSGRLLSASIAYAGSALVLIVINWLVRRVFG